MVQYDRNFGNCIWPYRIIRYGYGSIVTGYGHSLINSVLLLWGSKKLLPACIHACMDMHASLHSQAGMLAFMHKCLPSCIYACLHAYMLACMHTWMYGHVCLPPCQTWNIFFHTTTVFWLEILHQNSMIRNRKFGSKTA